MSYFKLIVAILCLASAHSAAAAISRNNVENNAVAPLGNAVVYALSASSQGCYTESISVPPEDTDSDKLLIEGAGTNSFGELIVDAR